MFTHHHRHLLPPRTHSSQSSEHNPGQPERVPSPRPQLGRPSSTCLHPHIQRGPQCTHSHSSHIYNPSQAHNCRTTQSAGLARAHTRTRTRAQPLRIHTAQFRSRTPAAPSHSPFSPPVLLSHKLFVFIKQKSKVFLRCPEP